ncbi:MAG: micrococcal nuclease [Desulforhopalus sp.]|jgi:micrococcal nuclease
MRFLYKMPRLSFRSGLICLLFLIASFPLQSYALTGKVVSVADGDTITILDSSNKQHKIRLYGIDTPEKKQTFGKAAKKYTSRLTYKKLATVKVYDTDRYGRTVGVVKVGGTNVNESLIKAGLAWQYKKYFKEKFCRSWLQLEKKAKASSIGLWKDKDPVPPWQWRKGKRNTSHVKKTSGKYAASPGGFHGNVKSHVFHSPSCRHYNCKNCTDTFLNKGTALKAGYRACGMCKP